MSPARDIPLAAAVSAGMNKRLTLTATSGMAAALAFLDPMFYPLAWVAFVPLLFALRETSLPRAYALGLVAGLVMQAVGSYWLAEFVANLKGYGPLRSASIAALAWLYGAHLIALPALLFRWVSLRTKLHELLSWPILLASAFALLPMPIEIKLGQTQVQFAHALQGIELTGVYGLDALIALGNAAMYVLLARPLRRSDRIALAIALVLAAGWFGYGIRALQNWEERLEGSPTLRVGVVQPNDPPSASIPEPRAGFAYTYPLELALTEQLAERGAQIIVWPESRYRGFFDRQLVRTSFEREFERIGAPVIFQDMERIDAQPQPAVFNTAALVANGTLTDRYRKVERIAFGEYLPAAKTFPIVRDALAAYLGEFFDEVTPGDGPRAFAVGDITLVPLICYETTAAPYVARAAAQAKGRALFVALSNDTWFGTTRAAKQ
ncbi:MAG TPA: apolipoprotein N-acyltransferase, partial [Steroidobacteraceae bacterium]